MIEPEELINNAHFIEDIKMFLEMVLAGGAVLALVYKLVYGFHKRVIMPIVNALTGIWNSLKELESMIPVLRDISLEFKPNHGSSLRDVINRVETGLSHNRNLARVMLANSTSAHFETDGSGRCTWVNEEYLKLCGMSLEECLGFGWYNAIAIEDREMVAREWATAVKNNKGFAGNYHFVREGLLVPVSCRASFSLDNSNGICGSIGTVTQVGA